MNTSFTLIWLVLAAMASTGVHAQPGDARPPASVAAANTEGAKKKAAEDAADAAKAAAEKGR